MCQPAQGYRAGIDPVLLAASVTAVPGQTVLELGCGAGVAALCLAARIDGLNVTGLEVQPAYAALARRNAQDNRVPLEVVTGDLADMPPGLRGRSFDHVIANPPYYRPGRGTAARDAGRAAARGERAPLAAWIDAATRRLRPKGTLTVIQRADRLPDLLGACDARLGDMQVLPLAPRAGRAAELVLLHARKGARGAFRLAPPLVLHDGARHERDGDDYAPAVAAVLRDGKDLPTPW